MFVSSIPVVAGVGHEIDTTLADLVADVRALTPSEAAERLVPKLDDVRAILTEAQKRLRQSIANRFDQAENELAQLASRPVLTQPLARIRQAAIQVDYLEQSLNQSIDTMIHRSEQALGSLAGRLNAINPLAVLARGYSLTTGGDGVLLRHVEQVAVGDKISTRISDGVIRSSVEQVDPLPGAEA